MAKPIAMYGVLAKRLGKAMEASPQHAVVAAGTVMHEAIEGSVRAALPTMRLARVGSAGAEVAIAVRFRRLPYPRAVVFAQGPLHLFDLPTRPHRIVAKRKKALALPDGFAAEVSHPGTAGKRSFERGVAIGERTAAAMGAKAARKNVLKVLAG